MNRICDTEQKSKNECFLYILSGQLRSNNQSLNQKLIVALRFLRARKDFHRMMPRKAAATLIVKPARSFKVCKVFGVHSKNILIYDDYEIYFVMIFIIDSVFCNNYNNKLFLKYCYNLTFFLMIMIN